MESEYDSVGQIYLDANRNITLKDIVRVGRQGKEVFVDQAIIQKIERGHEVVKHYINHNKGDVYGVTTGLGSQREVSISKDLLSDYNKSVIFDHSVSVGKQVSNDVIRSTILFRVAALAEGGSGISVDTFKGLLRLLNAQIIPVVQEWGSVGQADLAPLAQIALVLIGDGTAYYKHELMTGEKALKKAGISPVELQPRDALALIGTNSFSSAIASLAIWDAQKNIDWAESAASLSWIAFGANVSSLRVNVLQQHSIEAGEVGQRILTRLAETKIVPRSIQDPLSFRCIPQVHGYLERAMKDAEHSVLSQLNRPLDNPLLIEDELISNGNFDATDLAIECDRLRNALYRVIMLIERRVSKLLMNHFSGYPSGLTEKEGYVGLDVLNHTLLSLLGEATSLSQITPIQSGSAAEGVEDYGSMAAQSAQSLKRLVRIWQLSVAIELVISIQALSFSKVEITGDLAGFYKKIEKIIATHRAPSDRVNAVDEYLRKTDNLSFHK